MRLRSVEGARRAAWRHRVIVYPALVCNERAQRIYVCLYIDIVPNAPADIDVTNLYIAKNLNDSISHKICNSPIYFYYYYPINVKIDGWLIENISRMV